MTLTPPAPAPAPPTKPRSRRPAPACERGCAADAWRRAEGVGEGLVDDVSPAAAMLPAELLQPGEIIILLLKPSPWFIVLSCLKPLTVIALATLTLLLTDQVVNLPLTRREFVLLGVALGVLRLFWQFLEWLGRVYVLTDQRVIRVMGVLRVSVFETPLQHVQHTNLLFTIRERLTGLGTIAFATSGTGGYEAFWIMLAKPLDVHRKVVETLNRYRRK